MQSPFQPSHIRAARSKAGRYNGHSSQRTLTNLQHKSWRIQLSGIRSDRRLGSCCFHLIRRQTGWPARSTQAWRLAWKQFPDFDNVARHERRRLGRIEDGFLPVSDARDVDRAFDVDPDYAAGVLELDITDLTRCWQCDFEIVE